MQSLNSWLQQPPVDHGLLLDHRATHTLSSLQTGTSATLLIGPEGGLSQTERETAYAAGFQGVRLGPRVLRTETAALAALATLQALWGDLQ
jgi:16S rRNA (uracil1498-N3)-methyltransferase